MPPVSRETLLELADQFDLPPATADPFGRLLQALAAEPDPHTTVSDPVRAADMHLRDSLAALEVAPLRAASSIADLGAGAGFPGLPLAIALPDARVDLIEAASRKCGVIDRLIEATGLSNARSVHARAEDWARGSAAGAYAAVTARAVAPLAVLLEYAAPLLAPDGTLIAWKGGVGDAETVAGAAAARELGMSDAKIVPVHPYPAAQNLHLYVYSKVALTPPRYPRRAGMAAKRPLGAGSS